MWWNFTETSSFGSDKIAKRGNMLNYLQELKNYGLVGVKTSFEDEGATLNEVIMLRNVCLQAGVGTVLKLGGAEAIRDMKDAQLLNLDGVVAPMIESNFALSKFLDACDQYLPDVDKFVNIETAKAANDVKKILNHNSERLTGVTFGRVDFIKSCGLDRSKVNLGVVYNEVKSVFEVAKKLGLFCCLGGAVSTESYDFLSDLVKEGLLDKFETRYAMFNVSALNNLDKALALAQEFELDWLVRKSSYYQRFVEQDFARIQMIQERLDVSRNS